MVAYAPLQGWLRIFVCAAPLQTTCVSPLLAPPPSGYYIASPTSPLFANTKAFPESFVAMLLRSRCQKTIFFAIVATTAQYSALAPCHAPGGTISPLDQPCYPSASDSFCYPPSSICSSNKLCVVTGGQALRGSYTDLSFSSPACPNFCLHREAGLRHSADLHMTLGQTDPDSTVYCCNGESGNACDCSAKSSSKVRLKVFNPITTISSAKPGAPSASLIKAIVSTGASATSASSRFLQSPVHQLQGLFIP